MVFTKILEKQDHTHPENSPDIGCYPSSFNHFVIQNYLYKTALILKNDKK